MKKELLTVLALLAGLFTMQAQNREVNYDENKVPAFTLPALLTSNDGQQITTPEQWENIRRGELLSLFADQMYGTTPEGKVEVSYKKLDDDHSALQGMATRKQVELTFTRNGTQRKAVMLIYLPNQVKTKAPLFFAYNFMGNQAIHPDPAIIPTSEEERGMRISRWPVEQILSAGYAVATMDYNAFFPDKKDGHAQSILPLFGWQSEAGTGGNSWQAIGAWAWGMSRAMDYFETDWQIDPSKVILMGHSRQGKAALWAGAQDQRFAIVISNCSGCGGAALSKRAFGETVQTITNSFPHWFCKNFGRYQNKEADLPFDQHELIALVAPRPVYVVSAEEDRWADPRGEYLSAFYAGDVYKLYGMEGLETAGMPAVNVPVMNRVGYHIRSGKHDVTDFDWLGYIAFADKWLK